MTSRELCLDRRTRERKAFVNVLKAVPQGRMDYKPDPKSRTAGELAWLIAFAESALAPLIETGRVDWKEVPGPGTVAAISARTCGPWAARCRRSTGLRRTTAARSPAPVRLSPNWSVQSDQLEVVAMARVAATEFKARCLELMDRVAERRETYVITKRGKAVARLVPVEARPLETLFGWLRGRAEVVGDLMGPVVPPAAWETLEEWDELNPPRKPARSRRPRRPLQARRRRR